MFIFSYIFNNALDCLLWGVVITIVLMGVLYLVLRSLSPRVVTTVPFLVAGVVMVPILLVQFTLLVGAHHVKGLKDDVIETVQPLLSDADALIGQGKDIQASLEREYPLIASYVDLSGLNVSSGQDLVRAVDDQFSASVNGYIFRRWLFILLTVAAGIVVAVLSERYATAPQPARATTRTRRSTAVGSSGSGHRRARRR